MHERCFYERLAILCVGPLADVLLASETLNDARLDRVETLLAMDPIILSLSEILNRPLYEIEAIDVLIAFLRAHGAFEEDDLRIPAGAGIAAVIRRLGKALDRIEAPRVNFILPPPFRIIRSIRELREVGTGLKNCVQNLRYAGTDHWFRLADGSNVYIASDEPALLVALQRVGPDVWKIDELKGLKNASVDATTKAMLIDALGVAGVRVLRESPDRALSMLGGHCFDDCEDAADEDVQAIVAVLAH